MRGIRHRKDEADQRRFERAVLVYLDALYGFAMALVRNPLEAEDLVQETCLRAIKRARRGAPKGDLKAWLFTILRNIWINQRRREARGPALKPLPAGPETQGPESQPLVDDRQRPDVLLERERLQERIRDAIESLPEIYREVIILRCLEGFSYNQIAQIIGCPAGTVMSRISRARAELRRRLQGEADDLCRGGEAS